MKNSSFVLGHVFAVDILRDNWSMGQVYGIQNKARCRLANRHCTDPSSGAMVFLFLQSCAALQPCQ
jgi:hypothetical protein